MITVIAGRSRTENGRSFAKVLIEPETVYKPVTCTHLLLDCSHSMKENLEQVCEDTKAFIDAMSPDEMLSITIFSGYGTAKNIFPPAKMSDSSKNQAYVALENHLKAMDVTVFSESLDLVREIAMQVDDSKILHHAVLFTDGAIITGSPEDDEEERQLSFEQAKRLSHFNMMLSCIGYGNHYDPDFLKEMIQLNELNGLFLHINSMHGFRFAIDSIHEVTHSLTQANIQLELSTDVGNVKNIFITTPEISRLSNNSQVNLPFVWQETVELFVELPHDATLLTMQGTVFGDDVFGEYSVEQDVKDQNMIEDYHRVYATWALGVGNIRLAKDHFYALNNPDVLENVSHAYSVRERLELQNYLNSHFRRNLVRSPGAGLKPSGPNRCVLNVLRLLAEDKNVMISLPQDVYKRGGLKKKDPNLVENPDSRTLELRYIGSHQELFNFSLHTRKLVNIRTSEGLEARYLDRTYNVIRNGELVLDGFEATMSESTFNGLVEAKILTDVGNWEQNKFYDIDLSSMPLVSYNWARPNVMDLVKLLKQEQNLMAISRDLRSLVKRLPISQEQSSFAFDGIKKYAESDIKVDESATVETYEVLCCTYSLPEYKALITFDPSVYKTKNDAQKALKEVKADLRKIRLKSRAIVFACELTQSSALRWKPVENGRKTSRIRENAELSGTVIQRTRWTKELVCS